MEDSVDALRPVSDSSAVAVAQTTATDAVGEFAEPPALHQAAQRGDLATARELLDSGSAHVSDVDATGTTALHWAAGANMLAMCEMLVARGASANARANATAAASTPLHWACRSGNAYVVRFLLERGAGDLGITDASGFSPLHLAVHSSNVLMVTYLAHWPHEQMFIDSLDNGGRTPLHWALSQGDFMTVEVLLKSGASPHLKDGTGSTPLELAVQSHSVNSIVSMLRHGAEVGQSVFVSPEWLAATRRCGRSPDGSVIVLPWYLRHFNPVWAVSLVPFVFLVVGMTLASRLNVVGVALAAGLVYGARGGVKQLALAGWPSDAPLLRSTLLAGLFLAVFALDFGCFIGMIFPTMQRPLRAVPTFITSIVAITAWIRCSMRDPGFVKPAGCTDSRLHQIHTLMDHGIYDSQHFCIHTLVPIPARAHYEKYTEHVVARLDHYCPWVYNAVGLRTHRSFATFLIAIFSVIVCFETEYIAYVRRIGSGSLWSGVMMAPFLTQLALFTLLQGLWLGFLTATQLLQIAHGATTYEITSLRDPPERSPAAVFGSVPPDHPKAPARTGSLTPGPSSHQHRHHHVHGKWGLCIRLLGLHQFVVATRASLHPEVTRNTWNRGIRRNCMDFWLGSTSRRDPGDVFELQSV